MRSQGWPEPGDAASRPFAAAFGVLTGWPVGGS
jgi:hypothetical protein